MKLSVERLFSDPPLTGAVPSHLQFAPDGRVSMARLADDDRNRLDLWVFDPVASKLELLLDARDLESEDTGTLTDEEKAERERRRSFTHGVTSYEWLPDGAALIVVSGGMPYLFQTQPAHAQPLAPAGSRQTQIHLSSLGGHVSMVRGGDLYIRAIHGSEKRLTSDAGPTVTNGLPDFIAQEEMHRFHGHWWSADDRLIAFTRVDESAIPESMRYEIDADEFKVVHQHYPFTGGPNAEVRLAIADLQDDSVTWLDWQIDDDDYLARVAWSPDNQLVVQVQSRDQKRLATRAFDPATSSWAHWFDETAETWVELHDNLVFTDAGWCLTTTERDGRSRIAVYRDGELATVNASLGRVNEIVGTANGTAFVSGWETDPTTQHLYAIDIDSGTVRALTSGQRWHQIKANKDATTAIAIAGALDKPQGATLIDLHTGACEPIWPNVIDDDHPYAPFRPSHAASGIGVIETDDGGLYYRLTPPSSLNAGQRYPVIVSVYGGPGAQRVRHEWPPLTNQLFAQSGYGVFELDNRGSANRDKAFSDTLYRSMGDVEVTDQIRGVDFLRSLSWVDPQRIGMFGHSYGGYMTLMCLAKAPDIFAAGVSVAPVYAWELYDTHYTERYLGTPQGEPDAYARSNVQDYVESIASPLLVIHGMADDNVLFTNTTMLIKALQDHGTAFELMTYPGSKHALQEPSVARHRYETILRFFANHLLRAAAYMVWVCRSDCRAPAR